MLIAQVVRALLLGLLGWSFPRFLIAIGVPLDKWIERLGLHAEVVLWAFAIIIFALMFLLDGKYQLFERLFYAARPIRLSDEALMQFISRIEAGAALIAEDPHRPLDQFWHRRVIEWNHSVETLIRRYLPPRELFGYRTVNVPPALDQNRETVRRSLEGRRNKLRVMVMRLMPRSWDRRA